MELIWERIGLIKASDKLGRDLVIKEIIGIRMEELYIAIKSLSTYFSPSPRRIRPLLHAPFNPLLYFRISHLRLGNEQSEVG